MKLNLESNSLLTALKYSYIIVFFALLSGIFSPIITGKYADKSFTGILILFVGLMGALLIYKASKLDNEKLKIKYIIIGGIIMFGDFIAIFAATGIFG